MISEQISCLKILETSERAQLIHQVDVIYLPTANTVQMATYLEPEKGVDHPVRQKLGEAPDKDIKNAIADYMKTI